ncbi:MAG: caspase family protein [Fermentimonas sp.]|nr:caspase family protein [Fermentimonas sp.]
MSKYALVVGIDDYSVQGSSSLSFCVADANSIYQMLLAAMGFQAENIILLTNAQATRRNILSSLAYLLSNATVGDTVLFTYAGHGSIFPATTAPDNTRFYQSIIPYSGDWIYDFRLYEMATEAGFNPNEVNFTCFMDCCHSGGLHPTVNSEQSIPRSVPFRADVAESIRNIQELWPFGICLPDDVNELFPNVSNPRLDNNVLIDLDEDENKNFVASAQSTLIAACKYYELAGESIVAGHGYLTKALLDTVNSSNFRISYTSLIDELVHRVGQLSNNEQHPTLRGQLARMSGIFLEGFNTSVI